MQEFFRNPMVKGALVGAASGVVSAMRVDYMAFKTWRSAKDAWAYSWDVALWRWFQGGVTGLVGGIPAGWLLLS